MPALLIVCVSVQCSKCSWNKTHDTALLVTGCTVQLGGQGGGGGGRLGTQPNHTNKLKFGNNVNRVFCRNAETCHLFGLL